MAAFRGITQSSLMFLQPHLFFSRGFSAKVFVKGLSFSSTEKAIVEAFSEFGEVIEAKIVMDKAKNRPKGYGFVTFAKKDDAVKACDGMNGKMDEPFMWGFEFTSLPVARTTFLEPRFKERITGRPKLVENDRYYIPFPRGFLFYWGHEMWLGKKR